MVNESNPWKELALALNDLCVCYRMLRRPSEKLLNRIKKARKAITEIDDVDVHVDIGPQRAAPELRWTLKLDNNNGLK